MLEPVTTTDEVAAYDFGDIVEDFLHMRAAIRNLRRELARLKTPGRGRWAPGP